MSQKVKGYLRILLPALGVGVLLSLLLVDSAAQAPLARYAAALALVCLSIVVVGRGQREEQEDGSAA